MKKNTATLYDSVTNDRVSVKLSAALLLPSAWLLNY